MSCEDQELPSLQTKPDQSSGTDFTRQPGTVNVILASELRISQSDEDNFLRAVAEGNHSLDLD